MEAKVLQGVSGSLSFSTNGRPDCTGPPIEGQVLRFANNSNAFQTYGLDYFRPWWFPILCNPPNQLTCTNRSFNVSLTFPPNFSGKTSISATDGGVGNYSANGLLVGDMNQDGAVNLLDVADFIDAVSEGIYSPLADTNGDGVVNLLDVAPLVDLLSSS